MKIHITQAEDDRPEFDPAAAKLAWERTLAFMKKIYNWLISWRSLRGSLWHPENINPILGISRRPILVVTTDKYPTSLARIYTNSKAVLLE